MKNVKVLDGMNGNSLKVVDSHEYLAMPVSHLRRGGEVMKPQRDSAEVGNAHPSIPRMAPQLVPSARAWVVDITSALSVATWSGIE